VYKTTGAFLFLVETEAILQIGFFHCGNFQRRRIGAPTEDEAHQRRYSSPLVATVFRKKAVGREVD
jgi:hypothetical protein